MSTNFLPSIDKLFILTTKRKLPDDNENVSNVAQLCIDEKISIARSENTFEQADWAVFGCILRQIFTIMLEISKNAGNLTALS